MRSLSSYLALAIFSFILISCSNILDEIVSQDNNGIVINIDGLISQNVTRASDSGFEKGDAIGLYAINYTDNNTIPEELVPEGNQADNVEYVYDGSNWDSVQKAYFKNANTNVDIIAYYPYEETIEDVRAFLFEVDKYQNENAASSSDFLWGKAENIAPSDNKVSVHLKHKMSLLIVKLVEGQGFEQNEFFSLNKTVIVTNTTRKAKINFSDGSVVPDGSAQMDGIVMCPQSDDSWRAIVVPQTLASGCKLLSVTIDGIEYDFSVDDTLEYHSGLQRTISITVNKKSHEGSYEFQISENEISAWTEDTKRYEGAAKQYFMVDVQTPGTLEETIKSLRKNPQIIKNIKIIGTVGPSDFYFMRDKMNLLEAVNMQDAVCVDNTIPKNAFVNSGVQSFIFPPSIRIIDDYAFKDSNLRRTLNLPDSLRIIGDSAFIGTSITSAVFPSRLEIIGRHCFDSCPFYSGQQLLLPDSVKEIGIYAFNDIRFGGFFHLPESLEKIDVGAIQGDFSNGLTMPYDKCPGFQNSTFKGPLKLLPNSDLNYMGFRGSSFSGDLVIPDGITEIPYACFEICSFDSVVFPESLVCIGANAFFGANIGTVLNLPEGLRKIEEGAFNWSFIEEISLPSTLIEIGASAFLYDEVHKIISLADEPPIVNEIYSLSTELKNNCQVSVPEKSILKYKADPFWGQFKRLYTNYQFYLSHDSISCLKDGCEKEIILYAKSGMDWDVKSKPDWVDLSVSEGSGKSTIQINILPDNSSEEAYINDVCLWGREGEVIFRLCDKDVEISLPIYQITRLSDDVKDGAVINLLSAKKGNGINLVFLGDGYNAVAVGNGQYLNDLREAYQHFFDISPYKQYADYFNVSAIISIADESGIGTVQNPTMSKFSTVFGDRIQTDSDRCLSYVKSQLPDITPALVVLVVNSPKSDGVTYMYENGAALAVCPVSEESYPYDFRGIIQHEAGGHGFGKLADEYIYHQNDIGKCNCSCCKHLEEFNQGYKFGWFRNLSLEGDLSKVPWNHLASHPDYSGKVDVYEGGFYHRYGIYRSEKSSCMNNNIAYYSTISRQTIVEKIMQYAGYPFSIDSFYANDITEDETKSSAKYQMDSYGHHYDEGPIIICGKPKTE